MSGIGTNSNSNSSNSSINPLFDAPEPSSHHISTGYVRALFDFEARSESEISLNAGELIKVQTILPGGLSIGVSPSGKIGLFPTAYCEPVADADLPLNLRKNYVIDKSKLKPSIIELQRQCGFLER